MQGDCIYSNWHQHEMKADSSALFRSAVLCCSPFFSAHIYKQTHPGCTECVSKHAHLTDGGTNIAFSNNQHYKTVQNVSFYFLKGIFQVLLSYIILKILSTSCPYLPERVHTDTVLERCVLLPSFKVNRYQQQSCCTAEAESA